MPDDATLSIRLPAATRKALDAAARKLRRSRGFIVKEAIDRHLDRLVSEASRDARRETLDRILALKGAGVRKGDRGISDEEVISRSREIRGDD